MTHDEKETFYNERVAPLVEKLMDLCEANGINILVSADMGRVTLSGRKQSWHLKNSVRVMPERACPALIRAIRVVAPDAVRGPDEPIH